MATTKAGMFPLKKKDTIKAKVVKRGAPTPDLAQLGAMRGAMPKAPGDMAPSALGMKKGGAAMKKGGACYATGGSIDGIAKKGKTRGKII